MLSVLTGSPVFSRLMSIVGGAGLVFVFWDCILDSALRIMVLTSLSSMLSLSGEFSANELMIRL